MPDLTNPAKLFPNIAALTSLEATDKYQRGVHWDDYPLIEPHSGYEWTRHDGGRWVQQPITMSQSSRQQPAFSRRLTHLVKRATGTLRKKSTPAGTGVSGQPINISSVESPMPTLSVPKRRNTGATIPSLDINVPSGLDHGVSEANSGSSKLDRTSSETMATSICGDETKGQAMNDDMKQMSEKFFFEERDSPKTSTEAVVSQACTDQPQGADLDDESSTWQRAMLAFASSSQRAIKSVRGLRRAVFTRHRITSASGLFDAPSDGPFHQLAAQESNGEQAANSIMSGKSQGLLQQVHFRSISDMSASQTAQRGNMGKVSDVGAVQVSETQTKPYRTHYMNDDSDEQRKENQDYDTLAARAKRRKLEGQMDVSSIIPIPPGSYPSSPLFGPEDYAAEDSGIDCLDDSPVSLSIMGRRCTPMTLFGQ